MAKSNTMVNSYLRDVIAPLVFPDGFKEINGQLRGMCPICGASEKHCGIIVTDGIIGGHCVKCESTMKDFRARIPALDEQIAGYRDWAKQNLSSEEPTFEREHIYVNAFGKQLYRKQIYRLPNGKKDARWLSPAPDHDHPWIYGIPSRKHAPLYRLDEIVRSSKELPDAWVSLSEGEKDADNLVSLLKAPATCLPNGAITPKTKIHQDWLDPLKDRNVVIFGDNDEKGLTSVDVLKKLFLPIVHSLKVILPSDLLTIPLDQIKENYDVSDYINEVGKEVAYHKIQELINNLPVLCKSETNSETILPAWIIETQTQGRTIRKINEPVFCDEFKHNTPTVKINGVFYIDGVEESDDYIQSMIQEMIQGYFVEKTGKLARDIFVTLSNSCFVKQPEPDESKIYCKNNITLTISNDGSITTTEETTFTLTRIGTDYNHTATCPTFMRYIKDLFYEEDIPALQEYLGYCLIPCTRAQAGLFIKGKGGEGKSVLRDVIMTLFGHSAIQEYIHELGERFTIANLENKLVVIDDDLRTDLLKDTSTLKKLITARERFQVERKLKTKYDAYLYARIIAIGNTFIGSKFDYSDGFYRRQLLIDVKPKTRKEQDDDRFMSDKCIKEISGVLNWALEGLARLIKNNYHFSVSDRMARTLDNIKHDGDNSLTFIEDDIYIEITNDRRDQTTTAELFTLYASWCADNGDVPIKRKSFQLRMSERFKDYKIRIRTTEGRLQGFSGIRLTDHAELRLSRITEKERERIARLP